MINQVFPLLQFGLNLAEPNEDDLEVFSKLQLNEWKELCELTDKQGVAAIALDGLGMLVDKYGQARLCPTIDKEQWQLMLLEWIGISQIIEQGNALQLDIMEDLASAWSGKGCKVMVFKGQANGQMYPNPKHRNPGDIDCYLFDDYAVGNDIARKLGAQIDEGWYKHSQISYKGELFENHQYFVHTREGKQSKLLEKELEKMLITTMSFDALMPSSKVMVPPIQWNAMFLTYHGCAHFLSEGLRLKQLLDWTIFLKKYQDDVDWKAFYDYCDRYHFRKFADTITSICVKHLGVKLSNAGITTESPYTERIVHSIIYDEDYIYSEGEGGWKERWHVLKNLFRYRWKYEEIYGQSVWKQLWWYVSGYLLHTEN